MKLSKKQVCLTGIIVVLGVLTLAINTCIAGTPTVQCQVFFPAAGIVSGTPFNINVKAYNPNASAITFNRVVVAYLNPDLTVKGPYLVNSTQRTVQPGPTPLSFNVLFTINTTQPSGSLVPVIITLWYNYYTANYERGAGAGGAKVQ